MKISLNWLNQLIDIQEYIQQPEILVNLLTGAGLEVEAVENGADKYRHFVIGLILEKEKHPSADRLSVCKVTTGHGIVHQIVCGAQNHQVDHRVVVSLPGARLPSGLEIKSTVLRGVESHGMLCSPTELGVPPPADYKDGLLILPATAAVGESFAHFFGLDDIIFELKVTPNRADCLSHWGVAREIKTLTQKNLKPLSKSISIPSSKVSSIISNHSDVQGAFMCSRYGAAKISGVKVGPSPDWIKNRIENLGLRSINNVVDVTNFVMMELGHPMHAFDVSKLNFPLQVRLSKPGEKLLSLQKTELSLSEKDLVIADQKAVLALAGVVGGLDSSVTDQTTEILLESAHFDAASVRRSSVRHATPTDSSYRFSRGTDPMMTETALLRAIELLKVSCPELRVEGELIDLCPQPFTPQKIKVRSSQLEARLGFSVDANTLKQDLINLSCEILSVEEDGSHSVYTVCPPAFRVDLNHEIDFAEEYARLRGYGNIPSHFPVLLQVPTPPDPVYIATHKAQSFLVGQGFNEAVTSVFTGVSNPIASTAKWSHFGLSTGQPVQLMNPLSEEQNQLREHLIQSLLPVIIYNCHQGNGQGSLFEFAGAHYQTQIESEIQNNEEKRLILASWGANGDHILQLKAGLENLSVHLGVKGLNFTIVQDKGHIPDCMHRGQVAAIQIESQMVGIIGSLHPEIMEANKIRYSVAWIEINWKKWMAAMHSAVHSTSQFASFTRFQRVERDMTLVLRKSAPVGEILNSAKLELGSALDGISVINIYEGAGLEVGQKAVTVRMVFQHPEKTLTDEEILKFSNRALEVWQSKHSAHLRS